MNKVFIVMRNDLFLRGELCYPVRVFRHLDKAREFVETIQDPYAYRTSLELVGEGIGALGDPNESVYHYTKIGRSFTYENTQNGEITEIEYYVKMVDYEE